MDDACELVRQIVNKAIMPIDPKEQETQGYGQLKAVRTLIYARLKGLQRRRLNPNTMEQWNNPGHT